MPLHLVERHLADGRLKRLAIDDSGILPGPALFLFMLLTLAHDRWEGGRVGFSIICERNLGLSSHWIVWRASRAHVHGLGHEAYADLVKKVVAALGDTSSPTTRAQDVAEAVFTNQMTAVPSEGNVGRSSAMQAYHREESPCHASERVGSLNHLQSEISLADGLALPRGISLQLLGKYSGRGEDDPILTVRRLRDGWQLKRRGKSKKPQFGAKLVWDYGEPEIWTKAHGDFAVQSCLLGVHERDGPWYVIEHNIVDREGIS